MASHPSDSAPPHRPVIVAIDGPAGAGKSTVAAHLAERFNLLNLETGAMYRALALKALQQHVPQGDPAAVSALTQTTEIALEPGAEGNRVLLDGHDVTSRLREPEITAAASRVSVHPDVRHWMVNAQRAMGLASPSGVVMEGRDIGTVVFPNATVKIFLDASVEARGDRRFHQQAGATTASGDQAAITQEIAARDQRDRSREVSPLCAADDAVVLDTTTMTLQEVLDRTTELVACALPTSALRNSL